MKVSQRPKPTIINVADELGFNLARLPEIGPGCLKPSQGRGGIPLPDSYYEQGDKFEVKQKKGEGIGEKVKQEKAEKAKDISPSWVDVI